MPAEFYQRKTKECIGWKMGKTAELKLKIIMAETKSKSIYLSCKSTGWYGIDLEGVQIPSTLLICHP